MLTQTSRRGGDRQPGREDSQQGGVAGGPSEVADCVAQWAKLQLACEAAAGGLGDGPCNPEFQRGEIKLQTTD